MLSCHQRKFMVEDSLTTFCHPSASIFQNTRKSIYNRNHGHQQQLCSHRVPQGCKNKLSPNVPASVATLDFVGHIDWKFTDSPLDAGEVSSRDRPGNRRGYGKYNPNFSSNTGRYTHTSSPIETRDPTSKRIHYPHRFRECYLPRRLRCIGIPNVQQILRGLPRCQILRRKPTHRLN